MTKEKNPRTRAGKGEKAPSSSLLENIIEKNAPPAANKTGSTRMLS